MIDSARGPKFQRLQPQSQTPQDIDQKLKDVSEKYEKYFLKEMMKSMRSTVHESDFIKHNQGEKIFREELDQEYVEKWGDRGGIGLAQMIHKQLVDQYGEQFGIKAPVQKPQGPIAWDDKSTLSTRASLSPKSTYVVSHPSERTVTAPWSGYLSRKIQLAPDEWFLQMNHDNGLVSQMSFQGRASELSLGQFLQGGDKIGLLSPDQNKLIWNLGPDLTQNQKTVSE